MAIFTPGDNSLLDLALDLISPHSPKKLGQIKPSESEKVIAYIQRKGRHRALALLHNYGSDELILLLWKKGILGSGHRFRFTTRVDELVGKIIEVDPSHEITSK